MTRFSDNSGYLEPRALVNQTDNTNQAFANNMGNTGGQSQFAEYAMPTAPGRVPSSGSNFYGSGAEAVSYGAQGNPSFQHAYGGYGWAGNNPTQGMSFRQLQMYHAQQEQMLQGPNYQAAASMYSPGYAGYGYHPNIGYAPNNGYAGNLGYGSNYGYAGNLGYGPNYGYAGNLGYGPNYGYAGNLGYAPNYDYASNYGSGYGSNWGGQSQSFYTPAVAYQGEGGYTPSAPYPQPALYQGQDSGYAVPPYPQQPVYQGQDSGYAVPPYPQQPVYQGEGGYTPSAPYPQQALYQGQDSGYAVPPAPPLDNGYQYSANGYQDVANGYQYGANGSRYAADGAPAAAAQPAYAYMIPGHARYDYSEDTFAVANPNHGDARTANRGAQTNSAGWSAYDFSVYNNLKEKAQELTGHCIQEYDKSVPVRLGCARAVSLLVTGGYGYDVKDQSVSGLEHTLRDDGFTEVSIADMKPGDVICAYRKPGDYGHAAVYMGDGQIFNNDSDAGIMEIQSIAKYNKSEFKHFVILRRPARVPAVNGGDAATEVQDS